MSDARDLIIQELKIKLDKLLDLQANDNDFKSTLYSSSESLHCSANMRSSIPNHGMNPRHVKETIISLHDLDFAPRLNTSSYVNVVMEPEEAEVALLGATVNLADASVYPASVKIHDRVVNMIAELWNAPEPPKLKNGKPGDYSGAGTVGSTEACLLAGLALKFRWRKWYGKKNGMTNEETLGVRPNMVISSLFQAAWEKFFRYFDVEPRFVKPSLKSSAVDPNAMMKLCDDKTLAVVGILGNHYNGSYDHIWDIDAALTKFNKENGFQIGIHVDAASGGFIAPFQDGMPPFDFRLQNVLTMSSSGHKFGESICGTGWVVFRERQDLSEHIAISVSYLGGKCDSMTLNFSRPASACYVQYYKLLRLGKTGYCKKVANQMAVTQFIRSSLMAMKRPDGEPHFELLDDGDKHCLPVFAARLNNEDGVLAYNDIDLQHALTESHWYVSGYGLTFENPATGLHEPLFYDTDEHAMMFRVVVKSNLTMALAVDLVERLEETLIGLDATGYMSHKATTHKKKGTHKLHAAC